MARKSFDAKFKEFQERLVYAQEQLGMPSLLVYGCIGVETSSWGEPEIVTKGGEGQMVPRSANPRDAEVGLPEAVTLQGYVQARMDILRLESSAMYGPQFSVMLQREVADQVQQSSVTGATAFQQSVTDLGRAYEPCIVYAATLGYTTPDGWLRGDAMAVTATGTRPIGDYIQPLAAIQKRLDATVSHLTKHCNLTADQIKAAIREAMDKMPGPPDA